jgi:hypothetical protein
MQIQPNLIPKYNIHTGREIPCIGLGTVTSDLVSINIVAPSIRKVNYSNSRYIYTVYNYMVLFLIKILVLDNGN